MTTDMAHSMKGKNEEEWTNTKKSMYRDNCGNHW